MSESKLQSVYENSMKPIIQRHPVSTVYVENANNVCSLEDVSYNNDVVQTFSPGTFGSTNTFRFSRSYQFLGPLIANFTFNFEISGGPGSITFKEDFVAYHLIKQIEYTIGGTEKITIQGEHLLHIALEQCETQEKKDRLLQIAGESDIRNVADNNFHTTKLSCVVPLPWSGIMGKDFYGSLKPFPLHMLSEPIEIIITLRNANEIYSLGANTTLRSFKAEMRFLYAKIANVDQLKRSVYKYPHSLPFCSKYTLDGEKSATVDLRAFRKGELKKILFHFISDTGPNGDVLNSRLYSGLPLNNIELSYNGQKIWSQAGNTDGMYDLIFDKNGEKNLGYRRAICVTDAFGDAFSGETYATIAEENKLIRTIPNTVAASNRVIKCEGLDVVVEGDNKANRQRKKVYYCINLTEINSKNEHSHIIGADFSKQTVQLSFNKLARAGKLYVTYVYNALYQFDGNSALFVM
jgi:hypothetical protein